MKVCPNCNAEVDDGFDVCWNCNYSFEERLVVSFDDVEKSGTRNVNCLRCQIRFDFVGKYEFHEGARLGALGNLFELFVNKVNLDLYTCPKCGKVEFFMPQK